MIAGRCLCSTIHLVALLIFICVRFQLGKRTTYIMTSSIIEPTANQSVETLEATTAKTDFPSLHPNKSWFSLLSLAIGFLGIQFAYSVQLSKTTPIMESLGSAAWLTGWIWCAGPVTGVIVQPIVGALSDRTWTFLGRRRPFVLVGAILTALCLVTMPNVSVISNGLQALLLNLTGQDVYTWVLEGGKPALPLLFAAILLWILDASINTSQGPYRALVPDTVPKHQHATAFGLMSLMIGLGGVIAFFLGSQIETSLLFYIGAASVIGALLWTSITAPEHRYTLGKSLKEQQPQDQLQGGVSGFFKTTLNSIFNMPTEAKKLCLAHSFTWFGLMCMFVFFVPFVANQVYGATQTGTLGYMEGEKIANLGFMLQNMVCFGFSALIKPLTNLMGKKAIHTLGLLCFSIPLIAMTLIHDANFVLIAMAISGIGWATTLSLPFALLSDHIPAGNEGILTGAFNIFIAAPQFIASPLVGWLVSTTGTSNSAMLLGGTAVLISAFLLQWVKETRTSGPQAA